MGKQAFSQREFMTYLKLYPDADVIEIAEVRNWMKDGFSPYENGCGICDDKGYTMDFIAAMRFQDDMYQAYLKNPELFQEETGPIELIPDPDLPF